MTTSTDAAPVGEASGYALSATLWHVADTLGPAHTRDVFSEVADPALFDDVRSAVAAVYQAVEVGAGNGVIVTHMIAVKAIRVAADLDDVPMPCPCVTHDTERAQLRAKIEAEGLTGWFCVLAYYPMQAAVRAGIMPGEWTRTAAPAPYPPPGETGGYL